MPQARADFDVSTQSRNPLWVCFDRRNFGTLTSKLTQFDRAKRTSKLLIEEGALKAQKRGGVDRNWFDDGPFMLTFASERPHVELSRILLELLQKVGRVGLGCGTGGRAGLVTRYLCRAEPSKPCSAGSSACSTVHSTIFSFICYSISAMGVPRTKSSTKCDDHFGITISKPRRSSSLAPWRGWSFRQSRCRDLRRTSASRAGASRLS